MMNKSNAETHEIEIREEFYRRIEDIVSHSYEFSSVSEYVNYVLQEFLEIGTGAVSTEKQQELEQRLRDLGYL